MIVNLTEELFGQFIPHQVGNIVEYNKNSVLYYGRIDEVTGRFSSTKMDKKFEIIYKINNESVNQSAIVRKIAEH